jgi:hypothetical protein
MNKKYGNCFFENDDIKFIWGIKSYDDLYGGEPSFATMNDIEIIYDKKKKEYQLGIETAYIFEIYGDICDYLKRCLSAFTKYMDDNGLSKDEPFDLFFRQPCTNVTAKSIEELYTNFKIFVDGFCSQKSENTNTEIDSE